MVSFARTLGGGERVKTYEFMGLVVAASDWGYYGSWTEIDVLQLAKSVINPFSLEDGLASLALGSYQSITLRRQRHIVSRMKLVLIKTST